MDLTVEFLRAGARAQAQQLNAPCVGPEHILLVLLNQAGTHPLCVALGLDAESIRQKVEVIYGPAFKKSATNDSATGDDLPLTPRAQDVIRQVTVEETSSTKPYFEIESLLLALVAEDQVVTSIILQDVGVFAESIKATQKQLNGGAGPQVLRRKNRPDEWEFIGAYLKDRWVAKKVERAKEFVRKKNDMLKQGKYEKAAFFRDKIFTIKQELEQYCQDRKGPAC